jgi:hypothetical protein
MGFEKIHIFAQNPNVLVNFTENCQFRAKTDRNSIFLDRDPRIANRLSITVPYFNFYGFWKISHSCSKSKGVGLRFYRKSPVWGKIDRNSIFLGRGPWIVDRLYITAPYMNFYMIWKTQIFAQNPLVLVYGFSENC